MDHVAVISDGRSRWLMNFYAVTVNFNSSHVIEGWAESIRRVRPDAVLFVVDNYSGDEERSKIKKICELRKIRLILNSNSGYGSGLNLALSAAVKEANDAIQDSVFLFGNPDILFEKIPELENVCCAYMPSVFEGKRNRNPFMTKLQRRIIFVYWPAAILSSDFLFMVAASIIKLVGFIPSEPYAMHGSQFCLSGKAISYIGTKIFNESSFLYWEEMEFADLLQKNGIPINCCEITCKHGMHVTTKDLVKNRKKVNRYWVVSWLNWIKRNR